MRHIINILVSIATICQFFASVFNMLNMKKPETIEDSLYNDFVLWKTSIRNSLEIKS